MFKKGAPNQPSSMIHLKHKLRHNKFAEFAREIFNLNLIQNVNKRRIST